MKIKQEALETWEKNLQQGYAAATSGSPLENTKVILKQVNEAQKAIASITAVTTAIGGINLLASSFAVGGSISNAINGYPTGSVLIALTTHLMEQLGLLEEACEQGIKAEEAANNIHLNPGN